MIRSEWRTTELIWSRLTNCDQLALPRCECSNSSSSSEKDNIVKLSETLTLDCVTGTFTSE
jgi:hypothetical protein